MASAKNSSDSAVKTIATNRKAQRDYFVLDRIEAGIELRGAEVKSIRAKRASLNEAYAKLEKNEIVLHGFHIDPYEHARIEDQAPLRPKRLLLHRREIDKLFGQTAIKGYSLVPLRVYFKRGKLKVELGLCKGKNTVDKRETLKRKTADREADRAIADRKRRQ